MINSNCGVLYMRIWRQFRHCKFDKNVVTFSGEKFEMWLHLSPPSRPAQPKKVGTRSLLFIIKKKDSERNTNIEIYTNLSK